MITEAALCPSFHAPSTYPLRLDRASPASKIRAAPVMRRILSVFIKSAEALQRMMDGNCNGIFLIAIYPKINNIIFQKKADKEAIISKKTLTQRFSISLLAVQPRKPFFQSPHQQP